MKLGQLTEFNKRNNFIQKLYRKCSKKTSFRLLFFKKHNMR